MNIKIYGNRGSIPTPLTTKQYREKMNAVLKLYQKNGDKFEGDLNKFWKSLPPYLKYVFGGNTTCIFIETPHNKFMIDCGTGGKNITTDNVTARNLLNVQRIALRRENQRMMSFDTALYYDESLDAKAVEKEYNKNY